MSNLGINNSASPAYFESAGVRALRESARGLSRHIHNAQLELGKIAIQYGSMIINYQAELRQINEAIAKLQPVSAAGTDQQGQTPNAAPASQFYYKG